MDNVRVLKIDTDSAQKSVKDLRKELKELRDTLLSTEKGTEEYNDALLRSAEIQHTLKEQMEEINATAMDFDQIVGNCTKALGGIIAGFQAAKATLNLFGIENEEVVKSLQRMQNLMAITQALPAIDSSIKAFKRLAIAIKASTVALRGFSTAMVATGLGAIAVALGVIVANWEKIAKAIGITTAEQKKFNEERAKEKTDDIEKEIDLIKEKGKIQGYTEIQLNKLAKERAEYEVEAQKALIKSTQEHADLMHNIAMTTQSVFTQRQARIAEDEDRRNLVLYKEELKGLQEILNKYYKSSKELEILEESRKKEQQNPESYTNLSSALEKSNDQLEKRIKFLQDLAKAQKPDIKNSELQTIAAKEYSKEIGNATDKLNEYKNKLNESSSSQKEFVYENLVSDYENYIKKLKENRDEALKTADAEKILEEARAKARSLEEEKEELERLKTVVEYYTNALQKMEDVERYRYGTEGANINNILEERKTIIADLTKAVEKGVSGAEDALEKFNTNTDYLYKQARESVLSVVREISSLNNQIYNSSNNQLEDYFANQRGILNYAKDKALITAEEYESAIAKIGNLTKVAKIADNWNTSLEGFISTIDDLRNTFLDINKNMYDEWLDMLKDALNEGIISQEEYTVMQKNILKRQKMDMQAQFSAWTLMASQMLSNLGSTFSSIASMQDQNTEEGLQKYKDTATSGAVISMLGGVVNAVASAFSPFNSWMTIYGQIAMAALASASVIASGIAQIQQIQNTQLGSGYSSSSYSPSTSSLASIVAPVQYTQDVQGANIEGAIKDSRVYVVESDISNVQRKVSVTEQEARF